MFRSSATRLSHDLANSIRSAPSENENTRNRKDVFADKEPRSIRAYQKAGFKEIGRRRECRMMGGKLWDEVHMDCLSSEFERPVTPSQDWGFSAWLPPGATPQIEVGTDDGGGSR